jgi:hypothetical protein
MADDFQGFCRRAAWRRASSLIQAGIQEAFGRALIVSTVTHLSNRELEMCKCVAAVQ